MEKPLDLPPTPEQAKSRIKHVEDLASRDAPMEELTAAVKAVHVGCHVKIVTIEPGKRMFRETLHKFCDLGLIV